MKPDCMTPDELTAWEEAALLVRNGGSVPCIDCPVWFAERMRGEGRCNGDPGSWRMPGLVPEPAGRGRAYASEAERRAARRADWRRRDARRRTVAA